MPLLSIACIVIAIYIHCTLCFELNFLIIQTQLLARKKTTIETAGIGECRIKGTYRIGIECVAWIAWKFTDIGCGV